MTVKVLAQKVEEAISEINRHIKKEKCVCVCYAFCGELLKKILDVIVKCLQS